MPERTVILCPRPPYELDPLEVDDRQYLHSGEQNGECEHCGVGPSGHIWRKLSELGPEYEALGRGAGVTLTPEKP